MSPLPLRVVMLTEHMGACDGSATHVHGLATAVCTMGYIVEIIAGSIDLDYQCPKYVRTLQMSELCHEQRTAFRFLRGLFVLSCKLTISRPDIVHAHHYYSAAMATPICRLLGIPIVLSQHAELEARGVLPLYSAARVLAMSSTIRASMREQTALISHRVHTESYGTGVSTIQDNKQRRTGEPVRILFAGRLIEQKGPQYLLRALLRIDEQAEYRCIIAGDGQLLLSLKEEYEPQLPHVTFVEAIQQMNALYRWADICVFPFTSPEPFGLVTIEAGSHGKAVITTNVPHQNVIITDGVNGRLVPPGDDLILAETIATLIKCEDERVRLGRALHDTVVESYSLEAMTYRIVSHYCALLDDR